MPDLRTSPLTAAERPLALITGGTSGIGLAGAWLLGRECNLALGYANNHARAEVAKQRLETEYPGASVTLLAQPLRTEDDAVSLWKQVEQRCGQRPLILVNSAGSIEDRLFLDSEFSVHQSRVAEHLVVPMALSYLAVKHMYRQKCGRIVNISSISARYSKRGQCGYSAAKAGLEGFTRTLALEVAHRGITVNAVAPGLIDTPLVVDVVKKMKSRPAGLNKIPMREVGRASDVGALIRFLCSDEASYVTGAVFTIDGGRSLGDPDL